MISNIAATVGPTSTAAASLAETCVVLQASDSYSGLERQFLRLATEGLGEANTFLLLDSASGSAIPERLRDCSFSFNSLEFDRWGYATFGSRMLPGHTHFPLLRFFEAHPEYDFYWLVEYDVAFTGHWKSFFAAFGGTEADLLTCHVRTWRDEPDFLWWGSLRHPNERIDNSELIRSFNVIARFSRQALATLSELHRTGWAGHHEVVEPTLLRRAGLKVADIGGTGDFVVPGFERRFYTSFSTRDGLLVSLGTVRWRPTESKPGSRRNTLYHPVKPPGTFRESPRWRETIKLGREALRHVRWRIGRRRFK
ncbi:MAG: DUF3405 domain-containing protein [Tepidisphaeraceae bacterium]